MKKKIIRFLSGKYSNEGKAIYDAWYKSFDDSADSSLNNVSPEQIERELERIKQNNLSTLSTPVSSLVYWRIAASLLIIMVAAIVVYMQWGSILDVVDPVKYTEQVTPKGAKLQISLPDGSQVWLNAETKFRYPEKFKRGSREVHLEGEAYFEVAKDAEHPFIIHSGPIITTVLGTSFNIQAYPDEENIEVAVISGKVAVEKVSTQTSPDQLILSPNQKAVLLKTSRKLIREEFRSAEKYLAWKDGRLIADNLSVTNILVLLNRSYDANITLENDALGECHVTAEFEAMPLERVLDFLCAILKTTYSKKGGGYIIHGTGCGK